MKYALLVLLLFSTAVPHISAQAALAASATPQVAATPQGPDETAIRAAMQAQADAWNHADIPTFMKIYENSPDTTFIGLTLRKGYSTILERYSKAYSSPAQMGALTFTNVEVRLLPSSCGATEFAVVTGKFHLQRSDHGEAKKDDGIFSLVWRKGAEGWKILLDHTS
jgi:uncharacterized protein (TIGR02246 family)